MLKHDLIHPEINGILGRAGHHGKILIADGNYPVSTNLGPSAQVVSLNLAPGLVNCRQVLEVLLGAIPIEAAAVMSYDPDDPYALENEPPIWEEYRALLGDIELQRVEKWKFYGAASDRDHVLTIQTGERQIFANLLLTIGVRH